MAKAPETRIALIGPTFPYKGGISQYCTHFYRHLSDAHRSEMHTYRRLYPDWLFPGKSEPDPSQQRFTVEDAVRDISFLNPFSFFRLGRRLPSRVSHVIITWWTIAWFPHTWLLLKGIGSRAQVIFWCHNVVDHDASHLKQSLTRALLSQAQHFVAHTSADAAQLKEWVPGAQVELADLPLLGCFEPVAQKTPSGSRRKRLLFFGFVRPYKGLEDLLAALPAVRQKHDVDLVVAGEFWGDTRSVIEGRIKKLELSSCVRLLDRYIPNEELPSLFGDCDLVVLPYREATGSAVANLAVEMARPLVVTDVGSLPSCVEPGKNGYVATAGSIPILSETICQALDTRFEHADLIKARECRASGWTTLRSAFDGLIQTSTQDHPRSNP